MPAREHAAAPCRPCAAAPAHLARAQLKVHPPPACSQACQQQVLHARPATAGGRPSFYSHASAPGIVLAVGNTGRYLDINADQLCTWLSRDGGLSWEDVREDAHIYEFGDHGGVIVTAKHGTQARLCLHPIRCSHDHGSCSTAPCAAGAWCPSPGTLTSSLV